MSQTQEINLAKGFSIQFRTIRALVLREMVMRHGRENVGFVWVVLEPMILTCGVMVIWSLMGYSKHEINVVELVLTGYMPLTLWRHLSNNTVNLFRNNSPLLYHRRVSLFDLLFSRLALEFIGTTAALIVVWSTLYAFDLVHEIERLDLLILGWLMMAWAGVAAGALISALTERYEPAERFVQPIQYLNIPISGAFFLVDWLPPWAQHLVLLHPHVHAYEMFRAGYFGGAILTHYNVAYFSAVVFVMSFFGIIAVQRVRSHVRFN
jgi:capsular polysaccharide transport system permease protein